VAFGSPFGGPRRFGREAHEDDGPRAIPRRNLQTLRYDNTRGTTVRGLARELGVSSSTVHEHLRRAESTLLDGGDDDPSVREP